MTKSSLDPSALLTTPNSPQIVKQPDVVKSHQDKWGNDDGVRVPWSSAEDVHDDGNSDLWQHTNTFMIVMLFTLKPCIFLQSTNPELDFPWRWTCIWVSGCAKSWHKTKLLWPKKISWSERGGARKEWGGDWWPIWWHKWWSLQPGAGEKSKRTWSCSGQHKGMWRNLTMSSVFVKTLILSFRLQFSKKMIDDDRDE